MASFQTTIVWPSILALAHTNFLSSPAIAKIEGHTIVVWNDAIPEPRYVRYAWADNPVNPNLFNKEGLPASPFRTDTLKP